MGCPYIYYKRALQYFAHALAYMEDSKLAKELSEETLDDRLEGFILYKKEQIEDKLFYYTAGQTSQCVIEQAYEEGCDPLNASISGINMFEDFIGIEFNK